MSSKLEEEEDTARKPNNSNDDEEVWLSNHTISMRSACKEVLNHRPPIDAAAMLPPDLHDIAADAWNAAQSVTARRDETLQNISSDSTIPTIDYSEDMSVLEFRKRYLHANRPCLIRGLDQSKYFERVSSEWRTKDNKKINRDWFLNHLGDDMVVPVRQQETTADLDDEGRANECSTVNMKLKEWCQTMDSPCLYLKDWHFQKWWEQQRVPEELPLYSVPPLFRNDVLNNLLLKFTDGDYRFVYWGPPGSETPLHSDVLHSFSWSFNVVGEKKWIFYIPYSAKEIVLYQKAGDMVFVPATWKHKVENLVETLSINHNWITTANIDYTWECLSTEMKQVDMELQKWGNEPTAWDAKEFMLRGCVGLDVTAYFMMIMTELLSLLKMEAANMSEEENWERFYDIFRLDQILQVLLRPETHLRERMRSVLEQDIMAIEAIDMATKASRVVEEVKTMVTGYETC